jgi:predicted dehydrogenase
LDKVKVAVIGAGNLANAMHYPSLTSMEDVEIVGICDLDAERLNKTGEKFGIADRFADYREMLEQTQPDAVYALMPPHHLFDVAMDVMSNGFNLFVEKPPAVTTLQAEAMARMAESQGLTTAVGFQRRYHPMVSACWERVRAKGPINQVVSCFYKNQPPQQVHPYYRGSIDILHCDAIHAVDSLRYFSGLSEVKEVASEVRTLGGWYAASFNSLVYFENGTIGILLVNWRTGRRTFRFEFHSLGATCFAEIDGMGEVWEDNHRQADLSLNYAEYAGSDQDYVNQGFLAESRAFIDAVQAGTQVHNNLQDAVKSMKLADMVFENAINL